MKKKNRLLRWLIIIAILLIVFVEICIGDESGLLSELDIKMYVSSIYVLLMSGGILTEIFEL